MWRVLLGKRGQSCDGETFLTFENERGIKITIKSRIKIWAGIKLKI